MQTESLTAPYARRRPWRPADALVLAGGLGVAAAGVLLLLSAHVEVVREGNFFGYADIQEVELFGQTFYRDPVRVGTSDVLNGFLLIAIATVSTFVSVLLSMTRRWSSAFVFFLLTAVGAAYLAADEVLSIHETLGHNLRFLADLPGVSHPDDVILAAYAIPTALLAYRFHALIASSPPALASLAVGGALFVLSSAMDFNSIAGEERVEPLATLVLLAGLCLLAVDELRRHVLRSPHPIDADS